MPVYRSRHFEGVNETSAYGFSSVSLQDWMCPPSVSTSSSVAPGSPHTHLPSDEESTLSGGREQQRFISSDSAKYQRYSGPYMANGTINPRLFTILSSLQFSVPETASLEDTVNSHMLFEHPSPTVTLKTRFVFPANSHRRLPIARVPGVSVEGAVRRSECRPQKPLKGLTTEKNRHQEHPSYGENRSPHSSKSFSLEECYRRWESSDLRCHHPQCQSQGRTYKGKDGLHRHIQAAHFMRQSRCKDGDEVYLRGCGNFFSCKEALTYHRIHDCVYRNESWNSVSGFFDEH